MRESGYFLPHVPIGYGVTVAVALSVWPLMRYVFHIQSDAAILTTMVAVGILLQNTTGFPLPPGICMGILLLLVLVPLFLRGQKAAVQHNFVIDNANLYTARQSGSQAAQRERNQEMRDKGLISEQEYQSRNDSLKKE